MSRSAKKGPLQPRVIAVSNAKGGVGKTTTTINLAASLAIAEYRVLIIDLDPSGAVNTAFGLDPATISPGIFEIFSGSVNLMETIHSLDVLDIDLIPMNVCNSEQEMRLLEMAKNRIRLKRQLDGLRAAGRLNYDFIILDTPPALNDLTVGALLTADSVLIPLQCGAFALSGVERLMELITRLRKSVNPELRIEGVLLNFYERGTRASMQGANKAATLFGQYLLQTRIPKNAAIGFAAFERKPLALVDVSASGARAYLELARELLNKIDDEVVPASLKSDTSISAAV